MPRGEGLPEFARRLGGGPGTIRRVTVNQEIKSRLQEQDSGVEQDSDAGEFQGEGGAGHSADLHKERSGRGGY